jgi:hypothetical protein
MKNKLKNIHDYNNFKQLKLNEEEGLFDSLGLIFKKISSTVGKFIDSYTKKISKETNIDVIIRDTDKLFNDNINLTKQQLSTSETDADVKRIILDNMILIYSTLSTLNLNPQFKGKIDIKEIFKDNDIIKTFNVTSDKALGDNGTISNYLKTILLPYLYKNSGLNYVKESLLLEMEDFSTDTREGDNNKQGDTTQQNDENSNQDNENPNQDNEKEKQKLKDKSDILPGSIVTYKNSKGVVNKARVLTDQKDVKSDSILVDIVRESYVIPIDSITDVKPPENKYKENVKKLTVVATNWYMDNLIKPISDFFVKIKEEVKKNSDVKKGDLSTYNNDEVTKFKDTVMNIGDEIKTMNKDQLIKTRDFIATLKNKDGMKDIGVL